MFKCLMFIISRTICRSKYIKTVIKRPISVLNSCLNFKLYSTMPPKRRVTAAKTEAVVEEGVSDVPKKRGRKVEEVQNVEPEKDIKKSAAKAETKSTKRSAKTTQADSEEKPAKPVKEKTKTEAKPEEKIEKRSTRKKAEEKEKVQVTNDKQGPSGDKKETKGRKKADKPKTEEKVPAKAKKSEAKPTLLNATETKWKEIDFGCKKQNTKGEDFNLKITSWNVDGLRAWLKKDGLSILKYDNPDIFCLQETKCSDEKLPEDVKQIEDYYDYWCSSLKEGYAGVGVYTKEQPINVKDGIDAKEHDEDGRCLTLEFPTFYLVNVYVPNAGRGLVTLDKRLEWNEAFQKYIKQLDKKKPVILCGDMNVAHNEIDLANPKTNKKNAGFTQEERDGMTDFLADGYVDSFRELYPEEKDVYTFWSYMKQARSKNIGWRLDYFIISKRILENVCDNVVRSEVYGSDHCPITLFINI